ncbi:rhodanese-like domain-containing protein [Aquabacterium fontiphilum]|uniref:rhodanese-like domain-containing protein n=1 Tax=Aquabacterium fontiphilum TaxID=450365 RepID=UPI001376EDF1|nr:rhodanese-like domain-containing protein [Aquabacterium fontiphilum]NBD20730.1 rhodanese-like domain-containing protein [Aquabacterium fontiphilum]
MTSSSFLADNWYWILAAATSGGLLLLQQLRDAGGSGLSPAQAVQLINKEKAQVIDVCEPAEHAAGHIAGARNIPLASLGEAKGLPGNKQIPLVVVCATGQRSGRAVAQLRKMGYENAQALQGGLKAWREANLPVTRSQDKG